ncbi:SDR family oxidoreductase [Cupriavidus agavae]|uniref:NADP-dependent 3-hydroxy acid dehydrogenase YdfG n=1 Tax=Cupriavidus agavae TaxID=1001822 RepID=A0A4Q7SAS4_9BURK|nr:SDR family oxidoreductase [Cupriavidus agavae]RZT42482.1 NADP-dependent 3-hydroxy acid dehydrogenase YdfG [Cupriavidus agavae]
MQTQGKDPLLEGKRYLVTGGGRGLGSEICRMLGEAGAHVYVADVDEALGERSAAALRDSGAQARAFAVDVADPDAVQRLFGEIGREGGGLDGLVNNAAIDITLPVDEVDTGQWRRVLMVNLYGPYLLAHAAVPLLKAQGGGHIVNIASTASKRAWPNASAYHATKWGILGFSHALHAELRPHRIKVSAVVAGGMRTPFLLDRFADIDTSTLQDPANVARAVRFVLTQPEETVIPEVMVLPMKETSWP